MNSTEFEDTEDDVGRILLALFLWMLVCVLILVIYHLHKKLKLVWAQERRQLEELERLEGLSLAFPAPSPELPRQMFEVIMS